MEHCPTCHQQIVEEIPRAKIIKPGGFSWDGKRWIAKNWSFDFGSEDHVIGGWSVQDLAEIAFDLEKLREGTDAS